MQKYTSLQSASPNYENCELHSSFNTLVNKDCYKFSSASSGVEAQLKAQILRSQLFTDITLKIRQSLRLEDILQTTVQEIQQLLDADRVLILRLESSTVLNVVQETVKPEWDSILAQGYVDDCLDEEYLVKYPQGRIYNIPNLDHARASDCLIAFLRKFQVKSKLVVPLLLQEKLWGMLVIHQCSHPRIWSNWEIDLLTQIANQISIALGQSHLMTALADSEQSWSNLAQAAPVGIFRTDLLGNCLYVNLVWSKMTGMTEQEAQGQGWLEAVHPEDRQNVVAQWYQAIEHNLPFACEYRFQSSAGKITWVYGQAKAEIAIDGTRKGYVGTCTNITERLKVEEMQRALEREKELGKLKLSFFSMTSHELRAPLGIIMFAADVLENSESEWLDAKKLRNINRIKNSGQKITKMLSDVLTLARTEAEKLEFKPKLINLPQLCEQIVEEVQTSIKTDYPIKFTYKSVDNDNICLDEQLLYSILMNLLSNAVKYSPHKEEINFDVEIKAESVLFTIQDQGIGISVEDQAHIFETFRRGENVGKIEGTGLGLAIVKRSVNLHGGQITCDSQLEKGTTFAVSLPLVANIYSEED